MEKECAFCQIVKEKKPADIVFQNESVVVFEDIRPHAPVHLLIVPRKHIRSLNDLEEHDKSLLSEMVWVARKVAQEKEISNSGYRIVFNVERGGGQVIFHLHMHLLGGW